MFKRSEIEAKVNAYYAKLLANIESFTANRGADVIGIADKDEKSAFSIIDSINSSLQLLVKGTSVDGDSVKFSTHLSGTTFNNKLGTVELTIRSSISSAYKYKVKKSVNVDDNILNVFVEMYKSAIVEMLWGEYATANVAEINTLVASFASDTNFKVDFAVDNNFVTAISNDAVTFGVSVDRALSLADVISKIEYPDNPADVFQTSRVDIARTEFIEFINTAPNTVSIVAAKGTLINIITGVNPTRRPDKYIRAFVHKNAKYLNQCKSGVGYFEDTVTVGDESIKVFAVVAKDEDGVAVVLNPFAVRDNLNVSVDVLSLL